MNNKIFLSIVFLFTTQSSFLLSSGKSLPELPQRAQQVKEENKKQSFDNLLKSTEHLNFTPHLYPHTQAAKSDPQIELPTTSIPPTPSSIEYYTSLSLHQFQNSANELVIINDATPKIFLKRYNQEESQISLTLYPADINLLHKIHIDAKRITEDPASFIIKIDDQSYGIQYLKFNDDCRSLGEQVQDITDIEHTDNQYSLTIDCNNIVTLDNEDKLLLRCTEWQLNHITTTDSQFCITLLDSKYAITSINNNGTIKELLEKKELSDKPLLPDTPARPEATEQEKEEYKKMKQELGLDKKPESPSDLYTQDQLEPDTSNSSSRFYTKHFLIGGVCISISIVAIIAFMYFLNFSKNTQFS